MQYQIHHVMHYQVHNGMHYVMHHVMHYLTHLGFRERQARQPRLRVQGPQRRPVPRVQPHLLLGRPARLRPARAARRRQARQLGAFGRAELRGPVAH